MIISDEILKGPYLLKFGKIIMSSPFCDFLTNSPISTDESAKKRILRKPLIHQFLCLAGHF